jgi:hypothetical protein
MSGIAWEKLLAKRIIWTISLKEFLLWLLFFILYGAIYYFALVSIKFGKPAVGVDKAILLDISIGAGIHAILTLPIWWLIFRKLKDRPLTLILLAHIVCAAIFLVARGWMEKEIIMIVTHKERGAFSWWFAYYLPFLFYLIQFGIMHAYNFWLKSQRQLQKEKELLSLAYQSEVNALKAQIQPHFLFNTLNSISATVPPEMETTRVMIARLADTFRYALRSTQKHEVALAEELDFIHTWIEL